MFWGLVVQPNKKYSKTVSTPFHVSQAVLDVTSTAGDTDVQLILKSDKVDYILCILRKSGTVQVPLDLIFSEGDEISFRSVGGTVHLTGYLVDEQDFPNMDEGDSSDADEEVPQLVAAPPTNKQKRKHQAAQEQDSSSENDNSAESQGEEASDDDDEDGDDDSEDEDVDGSDDDSAEQPAAKIPKTNGMANGLPKKGSAAEGKPKKPQQQQQQQNTDKITKTLQGGVEIKDLRVGTGAVARNSKKVVVYYEGRFKSSNKVFDRTSTGKGFDFTVGGGQVIKGWDIGVQGMRVGGKRRIICPPQMAYGSKGSPPTIPGNATLVFDVELRSVN